MLTVLTVPAMARGGSTATPNATYAPVYDYNKLVDDFSGGWATVEELRGSTSHFGFSVEAGATYEQVVDNRAWE